MLYTFRKCFQIPTQPGEVSIKMDHFEVLYFISAVSAVS
jgi:hypothetical protein